MSEGGWKCYHDEYSMGQGELVGCLVSEEASIFEDVIVRETVRVRRRTTVEGE